MYLYHGGTEVIEKPKVRIANRPVDFGDGFYTTSDFEQASNFAKLRADFRKVDFGIVNSYEIDEKFFANFSVLKFENPSEEWFDFVIYAFFNKDLVSNLKFIKYAEVKK